MNIHTTTESYKTHLLPLFLGFTGVWVQVLLARTFMSVNGGSELAISIMLSGWLIWTGVGSFLYHLANKRFHTNGIILTSILLLGPLLLITYSELWLFPQQAGLLQGEMLSPIHAMWIAFLILLPVCATQGILFTAASQATGSAGYVYMLEGAGSAVAGILATVLAPVVSDGVYMGIFVLISSLLAYIFASSTKSRAMISLGGIGLIVTAWLLPVEVAKDFWNQPVKRLIPVHSGILAQIESSGQNALMMNGSVYASTNLSSNAERELAITIATTKPIPKRILVVGGSLKSLIEANKSLGNLIKNTELWYFNADDELIDAEEDVFGIDAAEANIKVHPIDFRRFVSRTNVGVLEDSLIWLRVGDPVSFGQNRLLSSDFFEMLERATNGKLTVAFSLGESANYLSKFQKKYIARIGASAIKALAPTCMKIFALDSYLLVFSSQSSECNKQYNPEHLWNRLKSVQATLNYVSLPLIEDAMSPSRTEPLRKEVEAFSGPVNSDMRPLSVFEAIIQRAMHTNRNISKMQTLVETSNSNRNTVFILAAILGLVLLLVGKRAGGSTGLYAVLVLFMGITTMGAETAILFGFQLSEGIVYEWLGALISVFMVGIALGGWLASKTREIRLYTSILPASLVFIGMFASKYHTAAFSTKFAFPYLLLLGILSGGIFYQAAMNIEAKGISVRNSSAILNTADHMGAAIGAILVIFSLPLFGVPDTFVAMALLVASAVLMLRKS